MKIYSEQILSPEEEAVRRQIEQIIPEIEEIRHDLHAHPELGYQEHRTSQKVQDELSKAGISFVAGIAGTGVVAYLPSTELGGHTVALRADMDALPIQEESKLPYASQHEGVMHACGHDGHTSVLLGVAKILAGLTKRRNNVLLLFQPAEEGGAGADRMIQEGALDGSLIGSPAEIIFGLHGWPVLEIGKFHVKNGALLAATDSFFVTVKGIGGHAAAPHATTDPVLTTAEIITSLQSIASRKIDPLESFVLTVAHINGGKAHNIIPESVTFGGTMRTLSPETRSQGKKAFYQMVEGIAQSHGCQVTIEWDEGYPVTHNDPSATDCFRRVASDLFGSQMIIELEKPVMGGEDFSYYGQKIPACFFFVGMKEPGDEQPIMVHTPTFNFNDKVLPDCIQVMVGLAQADVTMK